MADPLDIVEVRCDNKLDDWYTMAFWYTHFLLEPRYPISFDRIFRKIPSLVGICSNQQCSSICNCWAIGSGIGRNIVSPIRIGCLQIGFLLLEPLILDDVVVN